MYSETQDPFVRSRAISLGADDFVIKGESEFEHLCKLVEHHIGGMC